MEARSFKPTLKSLLLKHDIDRLDDPDLWICFAIYDYFVLKLLRSGYVKKMLLCQTVVPATVPSSEPVGISLPSSCKCRAGQFLHVKVSLGVGVCSEVCLSLGVRT